MKTNIKKAAKTRILAILIVILSPSVFFAQGKAEKVEQLKIAYFTKELNLTTQEAEKFWPVYNEMEKKIKALRKERKKSFKELEDKGDSLSVELVKKHTNGIFDSEIAEVNTKKEYYAKIGGIIGYKKATKVYKIERDFKRELLMRLKEERGQNPKPQRPNKPE
jgi:septal ring factor EnvC (AmiA/AmiB activator)